METKSLPFRKESTKVTLTEVLFLEQWRVPAGIVVKIKGTTNAGWICLPDGTKDERGFTIPKRLFKV